MLAMKENSWQKKWLYIAILLFLLFDSNHYLLKSYPIYIQDYD